VKYLGHGPAGSVMSGIRVIIYNPSIYTSTATFLKYFCRNIIVKVLISKYTDYIAVL